MVLLRRSLGRGRRLVMLRYRIGWAVRRRAARLQQAHGAQGGHDGRAAAASDAAAAAATASTASAAAAATASPPARGRGHVHVQAVRCSARTNENDNFYGVHTHTRTLAHTHTRTHALTLAREERRRRVLRVMLQAVERVRSDQTTHACGHCSCVLHGCPDGINPQTGPVRWRPGSFYTAV